MKFFKKFEGFINKKTINDLSKIKKNTRINKNSLNSNLNVKKLKKVFDKIRKITYDDLEVFDLNYIIKIKYSDKLKQYIEELNLLVIEDKLKVIEKNDIFINIDYIEYNKLDITLPFMLSGLGLAYKIYISICKKIGCVSTNIHHSDNASNLWYELLQNDQIYALFEIGKDYNIFIIDKNYPDVIGKIHEYLKYYNIENYKGDEELEILLK